MPIITDIAEQQRNKTRSNIFIDGQFFAGASNYVIRMYRLEIGKEVKKEELEQLLFEDSVEKAKGYVIDYHLNKSLKIIRDKLNEKGYEENVIARVMTFLEDYKIVDDGEYAKKKSKDLSHLGKKGPRMIAQTLRKNGVSDQHIEEALSEINEEDQLLAAHKALRGKIQSYKRKAKNPFDFKQKCYTFLMGRGFTGTIIQTVLETIEMEEEEDEL